jgi:hypothetical protein
MGAAQTGMGGASRTNDDYLVLPGGVTIIGSLLVMTLALRRRRAFSKGVQKGT